MKYRILFSFFLIAVLSACDHKPPCLPDCLSESSDFKPDDCPDNGTCTFEYFPDSKLNVNEENDYVSFEVVPGDNLVFHFIYTKHDNPMIADDEYEESIYFEVKADGNSFMLTSEDLKDAGALFGRGCFCADGGFHRIGKGCIYGTKINDKTWNVSLNLTTSTGVSTYNRMKQHDFKKSAGPI